ncbi:alpha-hydroxy acid oxidase [Pseudoroseomonas ludipueritiae]|uniref:Alpha-hydroxy-acid oxidizing protein n=1 Tax=Pseudoroseomonas ludipueritiae TaxID=198093 RepID=A0ABR7R7B0_9PROT|nr:alpha-hydroxy acid oxidase [Pseudoroseomonas ludipueritiae]MBC9177553.1 alpha-hydroxy-acid oxidizing protein [Pseudoroseomonas ludipueritiae]MCG7363414.1 alpha-hydroxy-acid oxidizing protein [Roseomonas sp. ACRSG]
MPPITHIEDLRRIARRRIPRAIFDYADRGSYDEASLRANREDLAALKLRQRVMIDVSERTTATTMLGEPVTMPVGIAPTGLTGLFHADGEILGCRAAHAFGVPFTLSTMSICSIEDVAGAVDKPFWFQLYVMRDRGFSRSLVERAIAARCSALVLTLDLQIQGQRHNDIKNGLAVPPKLTLRNMLDVATKPAWAMKVLQGKRKSFGNLADAPGAKEGLNTLSHWIAGQFDPSLSWKDVEWIRSIWPGKLILKGVLDVDDARIAASMGADAMVVSNHGGRQLDGAPSSISVLPSIVEAVGDKTEIMMDGGVRSGQDVLKALALGAKSCLIGKAWLYGLAAGGQQGVTQALEVIRKELDISMALTGTRDVRKVTPEVLYAPRHGDVVRPAGGRTTAEAAE